MKFNKTNLSILGGLFLLVIFSISKYAAQPEVKDSSAGLNVRVVDVTGLQQQFITEINNKLKDEFKTQEADLQKELDAFKQDYEKFQKNATTMSKDRVASQSETLSKRQAELQQKLMKFEQQAEVRRQEELKTKLDKLVSIIGDMSNKEKYDMVIAKGAAMYVDDKYDITSKVVELYNKK